MTDVAIIDTTPNAQITPTGVHFADSISIDEWATIGERLERVDRGLRWVMGDWLAFGADRFGARAVVITDSLNLATQTMANAASVCRRIPFERRSTELSFEHHAEIAHLPADDQTRLLRTAVDEGLSKSVLRQLVREEAQNTVTAGGKDPGVDGSDGTYERPDPPAPPARRGSSETVTLRICGDGLLDRDVLADGVARVAEGLQVWLNGHGLHATVEVET